ncbi:hypothetical protein C6T66_16685, partial [Burkholderia multivorans]
MSIASDDAVQGGGGLMSLGKAFGFYMAAVVALIAGAVIAGIRETLINEPVVRITDEAGCNFQIDVG